jgi:hypothetical protein
LRADGTRQGDHRRGAEESDLDAGRGEGGILGGDGDCQLGLIELLGAKHDRCLRQPLRRRERVRLAHWGRCLRRGGQSTSADRRKIIGIDPHAFQVVAHIFPLFDGSKVKIPEAVR